MHLWWGEDRNRRDESGQPSEGSIHRERLSGEPRFPCSLVLGAVEMLPRVGELRGLRLRPAGPALQRVEPDFYTQFLCLFMTGLRLGESLGLEWDDLEERSMCVARTVDSQTGNVGTTQGPQEPQRRHERRTDRSPAPLESTAGREGVEGGAWRRATSASLSDAQRQERRLPRAGCLQARSQEGGLPDYSSPHYCRHSYASILLSEDGGRLLYVQEQLGHA